MQRMCLAICSLTVGHLEGDRADKASPRARIYAGSLARAMWLKRVSECERSEARRAQGLQSEERGWACYMMVFFPALLNVS